MAPSPRNVSSRDDEEEKDSGLQDQGGDDYQESDSSQSVSFLGRGDEKRVDGHFCIGADERELHKVSEAD